MPADNLAAWIDELRRRLDAGELADLPPSDLGNALTFSHVERAIRRMLSDVEMFRAMAPAERALRYFRAQRRFLADNLQQLLRRAVDPGGGVRQVSGGLKLLDAGALRQVSWNRRRLTGRAACGTITTRMLPGVAVRPDGSGPVPRLGAFPSPPTR